MLQGTHIISSKSKIFKAKKKQYKNENKTNLDSLTRKRATVNFPYRSSPHLKSLEASRCGEQHSSSFFCLLDLFCSYLMAL